jgi:hypothetical protein
MAGSQLRCEFPFHGSGCTVDLFNMDNGCWLVSAHPPDRTALPIRILLIDVVHDELHAKFMNDWSEILDEDERSVWRELEQNLARNAMEMARQTSGLVRVDGLPHDPNGHT